MATEIIMPKAGMDMQEGQILKWMVEVGDVVEEGQVILEIMTDKVSMEVEAETSGVLLQKVYDEGDTVPVITTIGYIGEAGEEVAAATPAPKAEPVQAPEQPATAKDPNQYDVAVIGGGPAGYAAAIKAAQGGLKTLIVEKDVLGGTCLNRGCIPTKTYVENAQIFNTIKNAENRGVVLDSTDVSVDLPKAVAFKNKVVKQLTDGVAYLLKGNKVDVLNGVGSMDNDKNVYVDGTQVAQAQNVILAGGSQSGRIPVPGLDSAKVLTSDDILDLTELPKSLVVIGAGVVGLEMAHIFNAYGTQVTVIEMCDRVLPGMDKDVSKEIGRILKGDGIQINLKTSLQSVEETETGLRLVTDRETYEADLALLSIGRTPDLSCIGTADIQVEKNRVVVDEYFQTNIPGVYATGDINGKRMLAHAAYKMSEVAVDHILGKKSKIKMDCVPSAVYLHPEAASVGLTEEQAAEQHKIIVGKFTYAGNGRALAAGNSKGFVKVILDEKYKEILGVHIVGISASEVINTAAVMMANELTVYEAMDVVVDHPSYTEALHEAFCAAMGKALHAL